MSRGQAAGEGQKLSDEIAHINGFCRENDSGGLDGVGGIKASKVCPEADGDCEQDSWGLRRLIFPDTEKVSIPPW